VPDYLSGIERLCRHCGAMDSARLGYCCVCGLTVCDKCGTVHVTRTEKQATHHACLKDDHCGAKDGVILGLCAVCGRTVCDKCGNVQHARGEKRVTHNACLTDDDGGFSMIRFVR
jgi:hypothetical protein